MTNERKTKNFLDVEAWIRNGVAEMLRGSTHPHYATFLPPGWTLDPALEPDRYTGRPRPGLVFRNPFLADVAVEIACGKDGPLTHRYADTRVNLCWRPSETDLSGFAPDDRPTGWNDSHRPHGMFTASKKVMEDPLAWWTVFRRDFLEQAGKTRDEALARLRAECEQRGLALARLDLLARRIEAGTPTEILEKASRLYGERTVETARAARHRDERRNLVYTQADLVYGVGEPISIMAEPGGKLFRVGSRYRVSEGHRVTYERACRIVDLLLEQQAEFFAAREAEKAAAKQEVSA